MRPNRSLLNGLGRLEANMKANEDKEKELALAAERVGDIETTEEFWDCECPSDQVFQHPKSQKSCEKCGALAENQPDSRVSELKASPSGIRKDRGEVKTISLEPHWPGMVRYLHANPDQKWWKQALLKDDNGWFAAVAATHPDKAIAKLGRSSKSFKGTEGFAGIKEHLESLEAGLEAGIDDNEDYQSAVDKRQAKLKPHGVCPSCKTPKTPNEPCAKCGSDPELGDYLGTFLGAANPAAQRMLALLEKAGVKPTVHRVIGRLRHPVTIKAEEAEGEDEESKEGGNKFAMVTIDVEVRGENLEAWEDLKPGSTDELFGNPELVSQLESALKNMDNIHFGEAVLSDDEGNLM